METNCQTCQGLGHFVNGQPTLNERYPKCPTCGGTGAVLKTDTALTAERDRLRAFVKRWHEILIGRDNPKTLEKWAADFDREAKAALDDHDDFGHQLYDGKPWHRSDEIVAETQPGEYDGLTYEITHCRLCRRPMSKPVWESPEKRAAAFATVGRRRGRGRHE